MKLVHSGRTSRNMAASGDSRLAVEVLQTCFPTLDEAVKQYVEGVF